MTGTQSLSIAQFEAIQTKIQRLLAECDPDRWVDLAGLNGERERHFVGEVVSVVIHQAEPFVTGADKRVQLNRLYSNSVTIWLTRDGETVRTFGAEVAA